MGFFQTTSSLIWHLSACSQNEKGSHRDQFTFFIQERWCRGSGTSWRGLRVHRDQNWLLLNWWCWMWHKDFWIIISAGGSTQASMKLAEAAGGYSTSLCPLASTVLPPNTQSSNLCPLPFWNQELESWVWCKSGREGSISHTHWEASQCNLFSGKPHSVLLSQLQLPSTDHFLILLVSAFQEPLSFVLG